MCRSDLGELDQRLSAGGAFKILQSLPRRRQASTPDLASANHRKCNKHHDQRIAPASGFVYHKAHLRKPFTSSKMAQALNTIYKLAVPLAVGVSLAQASIYDVKGGTRAVIFDRVSGVKDQVVNEGTHFLIPWLQKAIVYDVRTKPRNISTTTGSKDLQMVSLTLRVLSRPDVKQLPKIYQV